MVPDRAMAVACSVTDICVDRGSTLVTLAGELDLAQLLALRRALTRLPAASLPNVVADLRLVDFMDCSALRAFVSAHLTIASQGGCLRIVATRPQPLSLLRMTGLARVFCVHDRLGAALDPLCSRHSSRS
jgi:anti-sigma B factor antagonist